MDGTGAPKLGELSRLRVNRFDQNSLDDGLQIGNSGIGHNRLKQDNIVSLGPKLWSQLWPG
jgi:hypothetical protein